MAEERFLVTGALGCIGAWCVKRLLDDGASVWTYDLPGDPHRLRLITTDEQIAKITFVEGDITHQHHFERTVGDNGITNIIHLAALQVPSVRANPVLGFHINVVGSTIVFEAARKFSDHVKGLAYASSVAVYGPADKYPAGPIVQDAPLLPTTLYGVTKLDNEWSAKIYWQDYGVRSIGVRPSFVYGPGRDQGMTSTPTKAMLAAAARRPYHISFGGNGFYQHAEDVAKAVIASARASVDGAHVFNLGGNQVEMTDVLAAIDEAAPESEGMITAETNQLPFPASYDGDPLEAVIGAVGWRPFNEGTRQTIEHFRQAVATGRIDVDRAIG